jgi:protein ECT2
MFTDAHLPDTEAWTAMTRDLRQSKQSRNALSKENSYVSTVDPEARSDASCSHIFSDNSSGD